jgi:hypothetical protein
LLLLAAHELREERSPEAISVKDIAQRLARDWGFWYTVTTNLNGCKSIAANLPGLTANERSDLTSKTDALLARIEAQPKSAQWKARALIGPRMRWYETVETEETVSGFGIWRLAEQTGQVSNASDKQIQRE